MKLCPSCIQFIIDDLTSTYVSESIPITNLRLLPWGNAELTEGQTLQVPGNFPSSSGVFAISFIQFYPLVAKRTNGKEKEKEESPNCFTFYFAAWLR